MVINEIDKKDSKIIINAALICKDLLKMGVREPKIALIDETLVSSNTSSEQIANRWYYIKSFSGTDMR